jgi:hypothetical protein
VAHPEAEGPYRGPALAWDAPPRDAHEERPGEHPREPAAEWHQEQPVEGRLQRAPAECPVQLDDPSVDLVLWGGLAVPGELLAYPAPWDARAGLPEPAADEHREVSPPAVLPAAPARRESPPSSAVSPAAGPGQRVPASADGPRAELAPRAAAAPEQSEAEWLALEHLPQAAEAWPPWEDVEGPAQAPLRPLSRDPAAAPEPHEARARQAREPTWEAHPAARHEAPHAARRPPGGQEAPRQEAREWPQESAVAPGARPELADPQALRRERAEAAHAPALWEHPVPLAAALPRGQSRPRAPAREPRAACRQAAARHEEPPEANRAPCPAPELESPEAPRRARWPAWEARPQAEKPVPDHPRRRSGTRRTRRRQTPPARPPAAIPSLEPPEPRHWPRPLPGHPPGIPRAGARRTCPASRAPREPRGVAPVGLPVPQRPR